MSNNGLRHNPQNNMGQPYYPNQYEPYPNNPIMPPQQPKNSNPMGIAGLICSILAYLFSFIGLQLLFWPLGLVFSIIGLFKKPKSSAWAGLILSILYVIITIIMLLLLIFVGGPLISGIASVFLAVLGGLLELAGITVPYYFMFGNNNELLESLSMMALL